MSDQLFKTQTDPVTPEDGKAFETLVGEGKKYSDQEVLATSVIAKDSHISKIEAENKELREAMAKNETIEEMLNRQQEMFKPQSQQPQEQPQVSNSGTPPNEDLKNVTGVKPEEIQELVAKQLEKERRNATANENLRTVQQKLTEAHGGEVAQKWNEAKARLGMTEESLQELAKSSPSAVIDLVGVPTEKPQGLDLFGKSIDSSKAAIQQPSHDNKRNQSYWKEIKKNSPNKTLTIEQNEQRLKDAQQLGEAFFN